MNLLKMIDFAAKQKIMVLGICNFRAGERSQHTGKHKNPVLAHAAHYLPAGIATAVSEPLRLFLYAEPLHLLCEISITP